MNQPTDEIRDLAAKLAINEVTAPLRKQAAEFDEWVHTTNTCSYCKKEYLRIEGCHCLICNEEWCIDCNNQEQNDKHIPCDQKYARESRLDARNATKERKPSSIMMSINAFADMCAREHAKRDVSPRRAADLLAGRCTHCKRKGQSIESHGLCQDCSVLARGPPK